MYSQETPMGQRIIAMIIAAVLGAVAGFFTALEFLGTLGLAGAVIGAIAGMVIGWQVTGPKKPPSYR